MFVEEDIKFIKDYWAGIKAEQEAERQLE